MQTDSEAPRRPARVRCIGRVHTYPANTDEGVRGESEEQRLRDGHGAERSDEKVGVGAPSSHADVQPRVIAIASRPTVATAAVAVAAEIRRRDVIDRRVVAVIEVQRAAHTEAKYAVVPSQAQPSEQGIRV